MMRNVILRPDAEADIEDAADYTIGQWGHEQARRYIGDLRAAIERLAMSGMRFREDAELHPGLRRMKAAHHIVFYLIDDKMVDVVRVMHEQRDMRRHLPV